MAENSKIEWCDHTFNPWQGCTKVSDGCKHCYAEARDKRFHGGYHWGPQGVRQRTSETNWENPIIWNRKAKEKGVRYRIFCASLADVFEEKPDQPELDEWRADLFDLIVNTPHLDWLLLTKRPAKVNRMIERVTGFSDAEMWFYALDNVWVGTSVENQEQADLRIPELLNIPAAVRFLSMEPLLGPVDLTKLKSNYDGKNRPLLRHNALRGGHWCGDAKTGFWGPDDDLDPPAKIHWVIVGGESGHDARPMNPDWVRDIRDQCKEAGVSFFFKQWGEWVPYEQQTHEPYGYYCQMDGVFYDRHWVDVLDPETCEFNKGWTGDEWDYVVFRKVGKKAAGRLLDGREWNEFPQP